MIFLGEITNLRDLRVYIYGLHSKSLHKDTYPKATYSNLSSNLTHKFKLNQKVVISIINDDFTKPIIVGFLHDNPIKDMNKVTQKGKALGISQSNKKIEVDGNISIPITDNNHYSLLTRLNEIKDVIISLQKAHLSHFHNMILTTPSGAFPGILKPIGDEISEVAYVDSVIGITQQLAVAVEPSLVASLTIKLGIAEALLSSIITSTQASPGSTVSELEEKNFNKHT